MAVLRLSAFTPGALPGLLVCVCLVMLMTLLLIIPSSDVNEKQELANRIALLEARVAHLHMLDQEKQKAYLALQSQITWLSELSERTNLSVIQLISGGNRTLSKMMLLNLTSVAAPGSLSIPNVYDHLPYLLLLNTSAIEPHTRVSRNRRNVDIVIGIPTVKRDKVSYLTTTLRSLLENVNAEERRSMVIVVFLGEPRSPSWIANEVTILRSEFGEAIEEGLIEILVPPAVYYPPDLYNITATFGDTPERMAWRTKQNLDYAYLMMYCQHKGTYYMQLEDDVVTKPGYISQIKDFTIRRSAPNYERWFLLEFSSLGFIGKLFRTSDLPLVVDFLLMFHREKPVDWLLDHILFVKVCHPEKTPKQCGQVKALYRIRHKPSLFQHIGLHSSLTGKTQKLKEKDFGKPTLHKAHSNPPAKVSTSLKTYQKYSLEKAYLGEGFFWGLLPQVGDWVKFELIKSVRLKAITLRSGNAEHPDDQFFNTSVEIRPVDSDSGHKLSAASLGDLKSFPETPDGFRVIGHFTVSGTFECSLNTTVPIDTVRLVAHGESINWVILSEIWIQPVS